MSFESGSLDKSTKEPQNMQQNPPVSNQSSNKLDRFDEMAAKLINQIIHDCRHCLHNEVDDIELSGNPYKELAAALRQSQRQMPSEDEAMAEVQKSFPSNKRWDRARESSAWMACYSWLKSRLESNGEGDK